MCVFVCRCHRYVCVRRCVKVCLCVWRGVCVAVCVSKTIFNMTNVFVYYTNLQLSLGKNLLRGDIKSFDKVWPY